jgi:NADH dehydrogenase (ubiquinone) Fe-S protein 1
VNTEGRSQLAHKVVLKPGHTRDAWEIIRALSEECGVTLPYNSVQELRQRIYEIAPHVFKYNWVEPSVYGKIANNPTGNAGEISNTPLCDTIDNFYMTDAISRNSIAMAKCSAAYNPIRFTNFGKILQQL